MRRVRPAARSCVRKSIKKRMTSWSSWEKELLWTISTIGKSAILTCMSVNVPQSVAHLYSWFAPRIIDNMPVTWCYEVTDQAQPFCSPGFPIGCLVDKDGNQKDSCVISVSLLCSKDTTSPLSSSSSSQMFIMSMFFSFSHPLELLLLKLR